jgi:hypothetical protein
MFGLPMPMLTIDMGVPLKRPVIVKNPRSDDRTNGFGFLSKKDAIPVALDGDPTVTCSTPKRQKTRHIYTYFRFYDTISDFSRAYAQMIDALVCCSGEI